MVTFWYIDTEKYGKIQLKIDKSWLIYGYLYGRFTVIYVAVCTRFQ